MVDAARRPSPYRVADAGAQQQSVARHRAGADWPSSRVGASGTGEPLSYRRGAGHLRARRVAGRRPWHGQQRQLCRRSASGGRIRRHFVPQLLQSWPERQLGAGVRRRLAPPDREPKRPARGGRGKRDRRSGAADSGGWSGLCQSARTAEPDRHSGPRSGASRASRCDRPATLPAWDHRCLRGRACAGRPPEH